MNLDFSRLSGSVGRILGLDTGLSNFGWCLANIYPDSSCTLYEAGLIQTTKADKKLNVRADSDILRRVKELADAFQDLRFWHEHKILAIGLESPSYPRNSSSVAKIGMAFGVAISEAQRHNIPVFEFSPQELKVLMTGKKGATKLEMETAVTETPGFEGMPAHLIERRLWAKTKREHPFDAAAALIAASKTDLIKFALKR